MAKMTREEAVELLKNRKVYVRNPKESEAVQKKLFECGFRWADGVSYIQHTNKPYLFIWDDMEIAQSSIEYVFNFSNQTEISANEILSIEIIEKYIPKFGDIVRVDTPKTGTKRDYMICIMPDKEIPECQTNDFFNVANVNKGAWFCFECGYNPDLKLFPASETEKQELFNLLAKAGKKWNAEKKCLEEIEQELNLCEILKDCPKGTKFYNSIYGYVTFCHIIEDDTYPITFMTNDGAPVCVTSKGWLLKDYGPDCECTIFPSKDQRDWSKWVCPKPDLPIDTPVMVSDGLLSYGWKLRYYAEKKRCWANGLKSTDKEGMIRWNHIIPFDKFNPNDIEESLKHDICKE